MDNNSDTTSEVSSRGGVIKKISNFTKADKVNYFDILLLGFSLALSAQFGLWRKALGGGWKICLIANSILFVAFFCFTLCLAEMTNSLPLTGGYYGFIRVYLSPYFSFFIGVFELTHKITYFATTVKISANIFYHIGAGFGGLKETHEEIYCLVILAIVFIVNSIGGQLFIRFTRIMTIGSLIILLIFFISSFSVIDVDKFLYHTPQLPEEVDTPGEYLFNFVRYFPFCVWFFLGIENIPLTCASVFNANQAVPKGIITIFTVQACFSFLIIFLISAQYPGALKAVNGVDFVLTNNYDTNTNSFDIPLRFAFMNIFNISEQKAKIICLPAMIATANSLCFVFNAQIKYLASSNLLPSILAKPFGPNDTPIYSTILFCFIFIIILLTTVLVKNNAPILICNFLSLFGVSTMFISVLICYIKFRRTHPNLDNSSYRNPLGIHATYIPIIVFSLLPIVLFFTVNPLNLVVALVLYLLLIYLYASNKLDGKLTLNDNEQAVLFNVYVRNANKNRRNKKVQKIPFSPNGEGGGGFFSTFSSRSMSISMSISRSISRSVPRSVSISRHSTIHPSPSREDSQGPLVSVNSGTSLNVNTAPNLTIESPTSAAYSPEKQLWGISENEHDETENLSKKEIPSASPTVTLLNTPTPYDATLVPPDTNKDEENNYGVIDIE